VKKVPENRRTLPGKKPGSDFLFWYGFLAMKNGAGKHFRPNRADCQLLSPNERKLKSACRTAVKGNLCGRQNEIFACEDCGGCSYAEQYRKTEKPRVLRLFTPPRLRCGMPAKGPAGGKTAVDEECKKNQTIVAVAPGIFYNV
jgi:hypothetical protein